METRKHFRKRDAILSCVRSTDVHPSADWVFDQVRKEIPDISLATVYRNLALFKQQGLIASVATVRGVERFDANVNPHVHFICSSCDAVIDLHQIEVPQSLNGRVEESSGCRVENCQLTFTGLCRDCRPANQEETL